MRKRASLRKLAQESGIVRKRVRKIVSQELRFRLSRVQLFTETHLCVWKNMACYCPELSSKSYLLVKTFVLIRG
jgi:hypothetical protein